MSTNATDDQKYSEANDQLNPPAGAREGYCPRKGCERELTAEGGIRDGDAVINWECLAHGYILAPVFGEDNE